MIPQGPSLDDLEQVAELYGFHLTDDDLESYQGLMKPALQRYARLGGTH